MDSYVLRIKESEYHKKDDFKPTVVMHILYRLCTFVMSIQNTYMHNIHNCIVYMLSYYLINANPLSLKF